MEARLAIDAALVRVHMEGVMAGLAPGPLAEAMRYASAGGKCVRGFLVLESARLHDLSEDQAIWPASAIEAMHAYSLVHDDLPAMDDDALRRGQPTVHVKWDEATAILVGDALQSLAFELVSDPQSGLSGDCRADLALALAKASGARGMVLGQALDMAANQSAQKLTFDEISRLQAGKTGALIGWAATAGARMAASDPAPLANYAGALGLAFQIQDDVIDVSGNAAQAGKAVRKDEAAGKATFVSLLGLDGARARAQELVDAACDELSSYGEKADHLRALARFVISRRT